MNHRVVCAGVNTDEVDSHAEDWDEVTVEILLEEEDIVLSDYDHM